MKRLSLIWFVLGLAVSLFGQAPTCYRVYLSDKNNTPYSINNPSAYLSQRAIDKRMRFSIPITEQGSTHKSAIQATDFGFGFADAAVGRLQMDEYLYGVLP